jgi:putative ABC transport system ATP-binding protein
MLKVEEVSKVFQSNEHKVIAIKKISFEIKDGTFAVIIGKSGSGKSTLLSLLGTLDRPSSGKIFVDNQDIAKISDGRAIKYRRDKIGFIFQNYNLIPNLTAIENVMLPLEFSGVGSVERRQRAKNLLEKVGLDERKQERRPGRLSGGEQQRVTIARALANSPKIILADEPTGNLDSATGSLIVELLKKMAKDEETIVIAVTHDEAIASQAEKIIKLKDGKIME